MDLTMKLMPGMLSICLMLLLQGGDRQNTPEAKETIDISTPDSFLKYINPQASLPAGHYKIVAATSVVGKSGNFALAITYDDGTVQNLSGSWSNSGGKNSVAAGNLGFAIQLKRAGGLSVRLTSPVDAYLYLIDQAGKVVAEDDNSGGGTNPQIVLASSRIDAQSYAAAYYAAIDPGNERDTFSKWRSANGFDTDPNVVHVTFRDTKDLGYGRDMYARRGQNGCAYFYVHNFVVKVVDGLPYNTLNLVAAI